MSEQVMPSDGMLRITLVRSTIGRPGDQERTVKALGLRRLHHTVERPDTPSIRGMVTKIRHLVEVEEIDQSGTDS
ncbi:MAG: 50S ribosomal protein L30 [Chloroflexota bacterium]|nr:50S ribosomal protein L30 [Chloroflexota bacterium]